MIYLRVRFIITNVFITFCLINKVLSLECSGINDGHKIECVPENPHDEHLCESRGCCWSKPTSKGPPSCFFPNDYIGYKVTEIKNEWSKVLVNLEREKSSGLPKDIQSVLLEVNFLNDHSLRLRFTDIKEKRYEIPFPKLNLPDFPNSLNPIYLFNVTNDGKLTITRKSTKKIIFETDLRKLIYSDQFHQLSSLIASNDVYGLGEHKSPLKKDMNWKLYTMNNVDRWPVDNANLYGSQPFYLSVEDDHGNSNGILLFNSNIMDVLLQPAPLVTWRPIGGILDFYVFLGSKPDQVIRQYITLIGKPPIPPLWGLGFHLCRCCPAPHNLEEQKVITQRMIDSKIPFDVQWNAKEYMVLFNMFTLNQEFKDLPKFVEDLHNKGMHYVPIIDPGIDPAQPAGTYPPYDDGKKMDIFIKNASGKELIGHTWNKSGKTVYPDFTNPQGIHYWIEQFRRFHSMVPIDGAWNDMNEISNLEGNRGSIYGCTNSSLDNPPYKPGIRPKEPVYYNSICFSAKQYMGLYYNLHNLYGIYEALATNLALRDIRKKRPFIISRSTFVGQGKYSGHWDGDVSSTYDHMKWTVPSIVNYNMFGIPLVGADICGFMGNVKNDSHFIELCSRWHELGAFYPFSRNHNVKKIDQDPVALGPIVVNASRNALNIRYSLLPYLYTLFYRAEVYADTVVRPLFFEWPKDKNVYETTENQFLWGSNIMIMPVLDEGVRSINAYFPSGLWYPYNQYLNHDLKNIFGDDIKSKGQRIKLEAPLGKINVTLRGGSIIPTLKPMTTTTETRVQNFTIIVALDENGMAIGELYWDDGDSLDTIQKGFYTIIKFKAEKNSFNSFPDHQGFNEKMTLGAIGILGANHMPSDVKINGNSVPFNYDTKTGHIYITNIGIDMHQVISITWK